MSNPVVELLKKIKKLDEERVAAEMRHARTLDAIKEQLAEANRSLTKQIKESWKSADSKGPWVGYHLIHKQYVLLTLRCGFVKVIYEDGDVSKWYPSELEENSVLWLANLKSPIVQFMQGRG